MEIKNENNEYKGDLKGFPKEVVEWMLDQQEKQGNKRDISVFENCVYANRSDGGFSWHTTGDWKFYNDVILCKRFDVFFERFPNKEEPKDRYFIIFYTASIKKTEKSKPEFAYGQVTLVKKSFPSMFYIENYVKDYHKNVTINSITLTNILEVSKDDYENFID